MIKVLIYGAGSIGTHLSQAARCMGWQVSVVDTSTEALRRMRHEIYPARYGQWDERIMQIESGKAPFQKGDFDLIMVGTPPDSHAQIATQSFALGPKILHVEKPLLSPADEVQVFEDTCLRNTQTMVTVGYDHAISPSFQAFLSYLRSEEFGPVVTIDGATREHWQGIFNAHPWLAGPHDSYLGYTSRGGGAACEHSHALHLVLTAAETAGWEEVDGSCTLDMVTGSHGERYDRLAAIQLRNNKGAVARVVQDVVTAPTEKYVRVQCEDAVMTWRGEATLDTVEVIAANGEQITRRFQKTRRDDFYYLMQHYDDLLAGRVRYDQSPLRVATGLQVMKIIQTAL